VKTKVDCQECNGDGSWLPAGACGGCEHCPSPRRCGECGGTGQVEVELEPEDEARIADLERLASGKDGAG
jgi:hypothetical protein